MVPDPPLRTLGWAQGLVHEEMSSAPHPQCLVGDGSREPQVSPCPLPAGRDLPETLFEEHLEDQFNFM